MEKWGWGAWAIGDPSPNLKNFHKQKHRPGKGRGREAAKPKEPGAQEENGKFWWFGWFSKRVLEYQKE